MITNDEFYVKFRHFREFQTGKGTNEERERYLESHFEKSF